MPDEYILITVLMVFLLFIITLVSEVHPSGAYFHGSNATTVEG
jgi:hypothetical protein